jgi:dynein light chain 4
MALDFKKVLQKPLVAKEDMNPEMSAECVEIVASAVDKYLVAENYEKAAQTAKEALERKFGPTWNVCVGEGFGYDVTYNAKHCLLVYYGAWGGLAELSVRPSWGLPSGAESAPPCC